jgi:hypothetical protein
VITSHRFELSGYCSRCIPGKGGQGACRPPGRGRVNDWRKSEGSNDQRGTTKPIRGIRR